MGHENNIPAGYEELDYNVCETCDEEYLEGSDTDCKGCIEEYTVSDEN